MHEATAPTDAPITTPRGADASLTPFSPLPPGRRVAGELVRVGPSPKHGLGVFAVCDIPAGVIVHLAPVFLLDDEDVALVDDTPLTGLVFGWEGDDGVTAAFALGIGAVFNHDAEPNLSYLRIDQGDVDDDTGMVYEFDALEYATIRPVRAGEELTVDYSGGDPSILWFDPL